MHHRTAGIWTVALATIIVLNVVGNVRAQCSLEWDPQFAPAGASNPVRASVVFDDGSGPALYVCGEFSIIGGVNAFGIARFDGEKWSNVGGTFNDYVYALAVFNDGNGPALYATGAFTDIGGTQIEYLAKWNGTAWSAPPGGTFNSPPSFLYVSDAPFGQSRLFATGPFNTVNGNAIQGLAMYDGSTWTAVGGASFSNGAIVHAFNDPATPASDLFISGQRILPGPVSEPGVFRFDGTGFLNVAPIGDGGLGVNAMVSFDDGTGAALYAGGAFLSINGVAAKKLAKWNGTVWSEVGGGVTSPSQHFVRCLHTWDDGNGTALYVGGRFQFAGGLPALDVARWDGNAWSALGSGVWPSLSGFPEARQFTTYDAGAGEGLVIVGDFTTPRQHIAFWNGTVMQGLDGSNGVGYPFNVGTIFDFTVHDDPNLGPVLIAGGNFQNAGPLTAGRIAAWDGDRWQPLGPGFNQQVTSVVVFDDGDGPKLYASGSFSVLNGTSTPMARFVRWDGTQWESIGMPTGYFIDMVVFDDGTGPAIYGATANTNSVHKWDGSQWTAVGPAFARILYALEVFDDGNGAALYLGTQSSATGAAANDSLMKWDGSAWIAVGGGVQFNLPNVSAYVNDMQAFTYNGKPVLAVGGEFTHAGAVAAQGVVFWDGSQWIAPPGAQPASSIVRALAVHDDGTGEALYAGAIDVAGTTYADDIAKLTPTGWEAVGFGLTGFGTVRALCSYDTEGGSSLYVGGNFTAYFTSSSQAAPDYFSASGITRWHTCLEAPSFISSPGDQTVPTAATVVFETQADGGELSYRWRRDGVSLNNNAQQAGVDTKRLTLIGVDDNDEGDYDVVVTNAAGSETSASATLTVTVPCPADTNADQQVNVTDLLAVIGAWGACVDPNNCPADINNDDQVNVTDLLAVIGQWGTCP